MRTIRSRRGRRAIALALAASMALPVSAAVATPGSVTASTSSETQGPEARVEEEAFKEAARTGQRVEILDRREEKAEFFANPDGTTTRRSYGTPKWTRFDGMWRQTDPTLIKNGDGSVAPSAPAFSLTFSGGGTQPMATMLKQGKKLALTWPTALPEPVIDGDSATYASVLPNVDLKLTADVDGFAQHLIVKNAQAAANPALRSIKLGIQAEGITLTETADNKLQAKDDAGNIVFSAPSPTMWEQPPVAPEGQVSVSGKTAARTVAAMGTAGEQPDSAPVATEVTGSTLTLTPDAGLLATADQFPLVIDPVFGDGNREKWAVVYSATPGASYPNGSGWNSSNPADEPRVGYNGSGNTRSFFAMNTDGLHGATISNARFAVSMTHSYGCTASTAGPTELWSSKDISTTPTWNNQGNYWGSKLDAASFAGNNATYCPGEVTSHDFASTALTNYVQQAANSGWDPLVFGLRVPDSYLGNANSYKRFRNNPVLEVDYNHKPTIEAHTAYEGTWVPAGDGNKPVPCGTGIGNSGIVLTAKVQDRDGGKIRAWFTVKNSSGSNVSFAPNLGNTGEFWTGQTKHVTMPAKNLPSGTYTWTVYATDGEGPASATTAACSFTVDATGPDQPVTVSNTDGSLAGEATDQYTVRKPVQLTLANPVSDVVGYCWAMGYTVSVSSTRCGNGNWVDAGTDANHTATITVTPLGYPTNNLNVLAYDSGGNHSPYDGGKDVTDLSTVKLEKISETEQEIVLNSPFVWDSGITPATQGAYAQDRPGDLNGDGFADFVATNPAGELLFYAGNGTTGQLAPAVRVGTAGWGGALIAHRGDLQSMTGSDTETPDGYEDFLVRLADNKLYLYPGNGRGAPWYYARKELAHPSGSKHFWAGLRQMVMPGNIDGKPGNDLITVECVWEDDQVPTEDLKCVNGRLLLYSGRVIAGGGQNQTDPFNFAEPRVIGTGGWRDFTNLAVNDLTGDSKGDLLGRNPENGVLYLYPGCLNDALECPDGFKLGERAPYGTAGWSQRPYLTSPGNIQGTVTSASVQVDDDGRKTTTHFKRFNPTAGEEYGDFWATTPADPDTPVHYLDDSGNPTSRLCPTGCLLTYPGGPTTHNQPRLAGNGAWATTITGIF